jgi:ABC-type antimicrobial peptide transport system permease subunit
MLLLAGFALAALLLAGVGIYGTVSQAVAQRTQGIGLHMALGAPPGAVLRLAFGEGLRMMVAGLVAGATLAAFAAAAGYLPARRATRVDPTVALRQD